MSAYTEPAFPRAAFLGPNGELEASAQTGMSLRDWFAGMALQGELASTSGAESAQAMAEAAVRRGGDPVMHVALTCYEIADAMMKARKLPL